MTDLVVTLSPPAVSRPAIRIVAVPAAPDAIVKATRYRPEPSDVAVRFTVARPGWVNDTIGAARSGSVVVNVTVSVWPARSDVAESRAAKASTMTDRARTEAPSELTAVTWAV